MLYAVLLLAAFVAVTANTATVHRRADEYPVPREALNAIHPDFHSVRKSVQSKHAIQFDATGEPLYVYAKFYEDSFCSTYKIFYFGYLAGTCLNGYDLMNNPSGSVLLTSNSFLSVTVNAFSGADCQGTAYNGTTYDNNFCYSSNGSPNINSRYSYIFGAYAGNTYPAVTHDMVAVVGFQGGNSQAVSQCAYNGVDSLISMFMAYNVDNCFARGSHSSFFLQCPNGASSTYVEETLFGSSSTCQFDSYTSTFNTGCISQTSTEYSAINNVLGMSQFSSDVLGPHRALTEEVSKVVHVSENMPKKLSHELMRSMSETHGTKLSEEALGNYVLNGTNPGYFTAALYLSNDTCGGDADTIGGLLTNTCLNEFDQNQNVVGSVYYTCVNGALNFYSFQYGDCSGNPYSGYIMDIQNCAYNDIFGAYTITSCTNNTAVNIPTGYGGNFNYDDSSAVCQSAPIEYFVNKAGSTCYSQNGTSAIYSCAADGTLTEMIFDSNNCTGWSETQVYLGECLSVDLFAYDDYEINSGSSNNVYFRKTCVVDTPIYNDDEFNMTISNELYEYTEIKCIAPTPHPTKLPTAPVSRPTSPPMNSPTMAPTYAGIDCSISQTSYDALSSFYTSLGGYNWMLTGSETAWDFDYYNSLTAPCGNSWVGLKCVEVSPGFCEIEGIILQHLGLMGTIPDMSGFPALRYLDLSQNNIFGDLFQANLSSTLITLDLCENGITKELPSTFGELIELTSINLGSNQFSGPIPTEWSTLTSLESMYLDSNQLSGSLPLEFAALSTIETISINSNALSGNVPEAWSSLTSLISISFSSNSLSGSLPDSWSLLSNLSAMSISSNAITGAIPPSYSTLTNLVEVDLYGNLLTGNIPDFAPQVMYVSIGGNSLTGTIPFSLVNSSALQAIDVSDNKLSGTMPGIWGNMNFMMGLNLEMNSFTGPIPSEWSVMTQLYSLGFCGGQLTGTIPDYISTMSYLYQLSIGGGNVTGTLPATIFNSQNLQMLSIMGNSLTGSLPESLSMLRNLFAIFITANDLSGPLPDLQTGNMFQIMIEGNGFSGPVPSSWTFENLYMLQLSGILITGSIPDALYDASNLQFLGLIGTSISGTFPSDFYSSNLYVLELIGNMNLTGPLPVQFPYLYFMQLSYNAFTGGVPELPSYVQVADLSYNRLSGTVSDLNCDLQYLNYLNLKGNGVLCIPQCLYDKFPAQLLGPSNCTYTPTAAPTQIQVFNISASQTLNNITAANFMKPVSISVFQQTVAVSMNNSGILASNVHIISTMVVQGRRLAATNNLNVNYVVSVNVAACGFTSMGSAYASLSNNLQNAVTSGAFTTTMNALAVANNCASLQYASSSSIDVVGQGIPTASPTARPSSDSSSSSSSSGTPQSTIIAVAVVVPVVVIAGAVGGFFYYKSLAPSTQEVTKEADSKNVLHNEL